MLIATGTPLLNARADLHDALSRFDERAIRASGIDLHPSLSVREGARQYFDSLLTRDGETYKIPVRHVENGVVARKLHAVGEGVKLALDPKREAAVAAVKAKQAADKAAAIAAREAAEAAPLERMECWLALPPLVRAAHKVAAAQSTPALAQLLTDLANALQAETVRPSVPPTSWEA